MTSLELAAVDYAAAPGLATTTRLELAAVASAIEQVRLTGEPFPGGAMVLLEQLAGDPCRCGTDQATCACDTLDAADLHSQKTAE